MSNCSRCFFWGWECGEDGNVAIKREQRLLADYAEHEQRKDCEAGLIMGKMKEQRAKSKEQRGERV